MFFREYVRAVLLFNLGNYCRLRTSGISPQFRELRTYSREMRKNGGQQLGNPSRPKEVGGTHLSVRENVRAVHFLILAYFISFRCRSERRGYIHGGCVREGEKTFAERAAYRLRAVQFLLSPRIMSYGSFSFPIHLPVSSGYHWSFPPS